MKNLTLTSLLIIFLILGGCSQNTTLGKENETSTDFPKKTIEIIVPFSAGGVSDTVARTLAQNSQKYLPSEQSIVVVNKPGGAGIIGVTEVLNAKPDGYKLGFTVASAMTLLPHQGSASYSHDSFQMVMRAISNPFILAVKSDAPWNTFEEWLDYAKQIPINLLMVLHQLEDKHSFQWKRLTLLLEL